MKTTIPSEHEMLIIELKDSINLLTRFMDKNNGVALMSVANDILRAIKKIETLQNELWEQYADRYGYTCHFER